MESLEVLSAREEEIGREWERLHQVINSVAQVRAENRNVQTFRILKSNAALSGRSAWKRRCVLQRPNVDEGAANYAVLIHMARLGEMLSNALHAHTIAIERAGAT